VKAHRVVTPQLKEPIQRGRVGHVVLGMDLEKAIGGRVAAISDTCGERRPTPTLQFGIGRRLVMIAVPPGPFG